MINLYDNFNQKVRKPLENNHVCNTLSDIKLPYEGLLTFQKSDKKYYQYKNGEFTPFISSMVANVKDFGAKGDRVHDDTRAIQDAINSVKNLEYDAINRGGVVFIPTGSYKITDTIVLPAFVRLVGEGSLSSIFYLDNNVNKTMLKTEHFDELVDSGKSWFDVSGVPMGFGIEDLGFFGNRTYNEGDGIKVYGYYYTIKNVTINYVGGTGFFSKHGDEIGGTETYQANFSKFFETSIDNLNVKYCKGRGIDYVKPTDSSLHRLYVSECEGDFGASFEAPCYVGDIHLYGNNRSNPDGAGLYIGADCHFQNIISESNYGGGVQLKSWLAHIQRLQMYGNRKYNLSVLEGSDFSKIDSIDIKVLENDVVSITNNSNNVKLNGITLYGTPTFPYTKNAIWCGANCNNVEFLDFMIADYKGSHSGALAFNQGASNYNVKAIGTLYNCDTGVNVGANFKGSSMLDVTVDRKLDSQKVLSYDFTPNASDRILIKDILADKFTQIKPPVFTLKESNINFTDRTPKKLTVDNPSNAYLTPVSTNTNVCTISEDYTITPLATGSSCILLRLGEQIRYCYVNVNITE